MKKTLVLLMTAFVSTAALADTLTVNLANLLNSKGTIKYVIVNDSAGFPESEDSAVVDKGSVPITGKQASFSTNLPAGKYVVSVIHDENNNDQLDTTMKIPREGFGFSNNPGIKFGPPSYDDCEFNVSGDTKITIKMKHLL